MDFADRVAFIQSSVSEFINNSQFTLKYQLGVSYPRRRRKVQ